MFNPLELSRHAAFLFIDPAQRGLLVQDYEATEAHKGLKNIALDRSLYSRTARLLLWRMDAIEARMQPKTIRELEARVKWPHGRALAPVSKNNPYGVPDYFLASGENTTLFEQHVELFVHDHFQRSNHLRDRTELPEWAMGYFAGCLEVDIESLNDDKAKFDENPQEALANLNDFMDDLAKQNAFYEIDKNFVGMDPVKETIWKLYLSDRFSAQENLSRASLSMHMAFVGSRGKGKTTVVPAVATALQNLGLLAKNSVETITLNKVAGTSLGADDVNVREAFQRGSGGVIFVDEADVIADYLARGHTRSQISQAINEQMETIRKDTCVIAATYPEHIDNFLDSDPGLRSRFGDRVIHFPDYKTADLVRMFEIEMAKSGFVVEGDNVRSALWDYLSDLRQNSHKEFAEGRTVREFTQSMQSVLQARLSKTGQAGIYRVRTHADDKVISVDDIHETIKTINTKKEGDKVNAFQETNPFTVAALAAPKTGDADDGQGGVVVRLQTRAPGSDGPS